MPPSKPSELPEGHAFAIIANDGAGIGFHRYYGSLTTFAMPTGDDPRSLRGLLISEDEGFADDLFAEWSARKGDTFRIVYLCETKDLEWPEDWTRTPAEREDDPDPV